MQLELHSELLERVRIFGKNLGKYSPREARAEADAVVSGFQKGSTERVVFAGLLNFELNEYYESLNGQRDLRVKSMKRAFKGEPFFQEYWLRQ